MFQVMNQLSGGYDPENPVFLQSNRMGLLHPEQKGLLDAEVSGKFIFRKAQTGEWVPTFKVGWWAKVLPGTYQAGAFILALIIFLLISRSQNLSFSPLFTLVASLSILGLSIVWLVSLYQKRKTASRLEDDLAAGRVQQTTARLEFSKNWQVTSPEGILQLPWFFPLSAMEPGKPYTVYYLPRSRYVLSIETDSENSLGVLTSQKENEKSYTQILQEVFGFVPHALPENRQARLHPDQKKQVASRLAQQTFLWVIILAVLVVVAIRFQQEIVWLIVGALLLFGIPSTITAVQAIRLGAVFSAQGEGRKYTRTTTSGDDDTTTVRYYIKVGAKEFEVNNKQYDAFLPGKTYRIYYVPPETMVNIEVL